MYNKNNQLWKSTRQWNRGPYLKGSKLQKYNQLFLTKKGIELPKTFINTQNFHLMMDKPSILNYTFKENLNTKLTLEFYEFQRFFGNFNFINKKNYPYLCTQPFRYSIYAIRQRGYDLIAYCIINKKIKIIKLTKLMSSLGLSYFTNLQTYLTAPTLIDKATFFDVKINKLIQKTHQTFRPHIFQFTQWSIIHFIVGAAMHYTTHLMWQKVLNSQYKKFIFKPRESFFKYYNYRRLWNVRFKKWSVRPQKTDLTTPLFYALFYGRRFYQKLFYKSTLFRHSPLRGRFVFKYWDKKFMKRFFIQSLVKQGKRLRAINWFKTIMSIIKKRLSVSRLTNFKAFYFTMMRLKPRYWLRKYKRGRRTEFFPTWIKDKRNKAEAVRLFLKMSKSTAPGSKTVSKQRMIELILLNTFYKKNDAYDALISYWKTVRKNMHNVNFVPWV